MNFYFGCLHCGSEQIYPVSQIRICNACHQWSSTLDPPNFLPGQILVRTMIGAPGFHRGVYLGSGLVCHSAVGEGVCLTTVPGFGQGRLVWATTEAAGSAAELRQMWSRARSTQGLRWTVTQNCEDVASYVRDGIGDSPTRNLVFALGAVALLVALAGDPKRL